MPVYTYTPTWVPNQANTSSDRFMSTPIQPAELAFTEAGIPFSSAFDDIYHSDDGGVGQARHVFMGGNDLPARWRNKSRFVILETGFGLGLNFLTTWQAWRADTARCDTLHFISLEKYPFSADDLRTLHQQWPDFTDMANELQQQWPLLAPGTHRLHLEGGRVCLTLIFGDALDALPKLVAEVDAFYLDGFAPLKNPALWSPPLFKQVARLAAPEATAATYTVAAIVREGIQSVGFRWEKRPGFGKKRNMLSARYQNPRPSHLQIPVTQRAIVLGAGLAGTSVTERLTARGWHITLIDRRSGPAQECSGNPVGALLPLMSLDDNRQSRLSRASLLYAWRHLRHISPGQVDWWQCNGVLHQASDETDFQHQAQVVDTLALPAEFVHMVNREEAKQCVGRPVTIGGWWFGQAGWANPGSICQANLDKAGPLLTTRFNTEVKQIVYDDKLHEWRCLDRTGQLIASAPMLILANAGYAHLFTPSQHLPLSQAWRQLTCIPATQTPTLNHVVCGDGYITPAWRGIRAIGASTASGPAQPDVAGHHANLGLAERLLPGFTQGLQAALQAGRVSYRPATPDRLPIVGPIADASAFNPRKHHRPQLVPRQAGLFALLGLGARGLTWSALMAELLASQIHAEPLPLERDLVDAVDPARFLLRAQIKPTDD
ncbi:bifunctional tRNA (5-methylaminomethyl-2-thiouridine)(34)-methyltransferase MnmD/FAD-dependent 5-carboxymethylaminomethyl-2-thiouridine(34) oxidoreductase MnmC [Chitinivorax sp. B]|uniref:bifunctional tRNA (5-methylaminomethyl-2-thiouridine)(34)-methyltransferase MnmD/FAD-dependent 5-carboxymethylaminomethyl-2-thiouridine(34) oxidoreductase MnmC n=1 Tax=Chitinivorax sp. B TaxID=2502235 RepID=UPI002017EF15|nr:bifunctional tRNA (5-methylaminomethyl-2-thiouridine)(34)-methyltransferase MnmD/FAD-dependent 5-carboxymethylaminomethyl-2-thiouridine(34) oxidoreductase MnmC [Chitinivorax sp. B]